MPTEQEIRDLCLRISRAETEEEFRACLSQLKTALREHIVEAGNLGIHLILKAPKTTTPPETVTIKEGTRD